MDDALAVAVRTGVCEVVRDDMTELFLTVPGATADQLPALARTLCEERGAAIVRAEITGPAGDPAAASGAESLAAELEAPVTWLLGGTYARGAMGGLHLHAVAGAQVTPLQLEGHLVGTAIAGRYATEVFVGGLDSAHPKAPRPAQARRTFERMEEVLAQVDMDFSHVVRTWLFLDDILSWYGEFNQVRTAFFHERGVFDGLVPASTGIGGSNPAGTAMLTGLYAVKPLDPSVVVQALPSPLQCPALKYGSSFSRAAEADMPDLRRLLVSGTASIAANGETVHVGDIDGQVARTCEVVEAILRSREMGWQDVTRAIVYVRHEADREAFERFRAAAGMPPLPAVVAHNVICRDELLFEIEVDAVLGRSG
ncbi:MAG: hypothetical protein HPY69_18825 [Armatimonadetes bacterium]|nr:hypothetical protein [Armatimonadota bacterium]